MFQPIVNLFDGSVTGYKPWRGPEGFAAMTRWSCVRGCTNEWSDSRPRLGMRRRAVEDGAAASPGKYALPEHQRGSLLDPLHGRRPAPPPVALGRARTPDCRARDHRARAHSRLRVLGTRLIGRRRWRRALSPLAKAKQPWRAAAWLCWARNNLGSSLGTHLIDGVEWRLRHAVEAREARARTTSRMRASPAWAPNASPTSWDSELECTGRSRTHSTNGLRGWSSVRSCRRQAARRPARSVGR